MTRNKQKHNTGTYNEEKQTNNQAQEQNAPNKTTDVNACTRDGKQFLLFSLNTYCVAKDQYKSCR
jgi:hypothetical protein